MSNPPRFKGVENISSGSTHLLKIFVAIGY